MSMVDLTLASHTNVKHNGIDFVESSPIPKHTSVLTDDLTDKNIPLLIAKNCYSQADLKSFSPPKPLVHG